MNQRPFSPVTGQPFKVENYYFQLILQKLISKRPQPAASLTYTFTPFKDSQKYEGSKPLQLQLGKGDAYPLEGAKLNFVAISYNPSKSLSFAIRMIQNGSTLDKEVGEYMLDANNYIDHFVQSENGAFTLKIDFNDDWAAEAELYVERSRYGLERLVKEVKNPKLKQNGEAVPISHQSIKQQRKKLDLQEAEQEIPHANRFKKFSPRRESQEDLQKKNQHFNRKNQDPPKGEIVPELKKEDKKSPKAAFVPKKEWIIPEAEKYLAKNTKSSSRSNSIHEKTAQALKEEPVEQPRRRPKPVQEPSFAEKLPVKPKYLILVAIVLALLLAGSFFLKSDSPQDLIKSPPPPKLGKSKKADKPAKPQKTAKVKK